LQELFSVLIGRSDIVVIDCVKMRVVARNTLLGHSRANHLFRNFIGSAEHTMAGKFGFSNAIAAIMTVVAGASLVADRWISVDR
jgi:hypothetical protein